MRAILPLLLLILCSIINRVDARETSTLSNDRLDIESHQTDDLLKKHPFETRIKSAEYESTIFNLAIRNMQQEGINQYPTRNEDNKNVMEKLNLPPGSIAENTPVCNSATVEYYRGYGDKKSAQSVINRCQKKLEKNNFGTFTSADKFIPSIVYLRSPLEVCTGFLINNTTVVTAAHCNVDTAYFSNGESRKVSKQNGKVCFQTEGSYCDYAALTIDKINIALPPIQWQQADVNDDLWIPGVAISSLETIPKSYPTSIMAATDNQQNKSCKVVYINNNCLIHLCTVLQGFSGAPIVNMTKSKKENSVVISGIHISSEQTLSKKMCQLDTEKLLANYGVPKSKLPF
ncbi:trypsin-like serine protease [Kosakonia quasisacchari]|uniref:Trypsin-like serine protease n=1 Tax=Kosakonia quasisacchari TaxID=2529380 RepID=A0A4V2LYK1_9ENTR|nr:trypsin-like serine protease [Kosakonia quasisacchari]TCC04536.1 trypsin-like serine protease [Kosakonia quasisacchari]